MSRGGPIAERIQRIKTLVEPVIDREGYELIDAEFASDHGRNVLRLFIDTIPPGTPERGVSVDDCAVVSRVVGDLLEVEDAITGDYHLEISSPGLFRPLTKPEHFARAMGVRVKVKTFDKVHDRRVFVGELTNYGAESLTVNVDGRPLEVPLAQIAKANLEPLMDF